MAPNTSMTMDLRRVTDRALLEDFHLVEDAAFAHDFVGLPADPLEEHLPVVLGQMPSGEHVTYHVGYVGRVPVAVHTVSLWTLDNLDAANVESRVHPDHRGRGHERAIVEHAIDEVRAAGRHRVFIEAHWLPDGSEGPGFPLLRELGAEPVLDDYRRVLDLEAFPVGAPPEPPNGYRVEQWVDRAPQELVDGLCYLLHRMVLDAPMGQMDYEPERWDAARYRDSEDSAVRRHRTRFTTAVVHEETGEVAGLTEIGINLHRAQVGFQWNTIVLPEHRGRRLGMVLKAWNHQAVTRQVPELRYLNTWNATSNSFMIDVNEALGFRVAEKWTEWQLDL